MKATQYPNDALEGFNNLTHNITDATATYNTVDRMVSYFGRVIYNYADRYLLNVSLRRQSAIGRPNRKRLAAVTTVAHPQFGIGDSPFLVPEGFVACPPCRTEDRD